MNYRIFFISSIFILFGFFTANLFKEISANIILYYIYNDKKYYKNYKNGDKIALCNGMEFSFNKIKGSYCAKLNRNVYDVFQKNNEHFSPKYFLSNNKFYFWPVINDKPYNRFHGALVSKKDGNIIWVNYYEPLPVMILIDENNE